VINPGLHGIWFPLRVSVGLDTREKKAREGKPLTCGAQLSANEGERKGARAAWALA